MAMKSAVTFMEHDSQALTNFPVSTDEHGTFSRDYASFRGYIGEFGRLEKPTPTPQAMLVESFPADSTLGAHFHDVDQFQLFFPSEGAWYQRTPIEHTMVHYADAYTTYGPFGSGASDLSFYTLRPEHALVSGPMPGSRDLLVSGGPRRNLHVDVPEIDAGPPEGASCRSLFSKHADRLDVFHVRGRVGTALPCPPSVGTGGQYYVVLGGSVRWGAVTLGMKSLGWVGPEAARPSLTVEGDRPAEVLVLQFPSGIR
jgi:hypothetical protein